MDEHSEVDISSFGGFRFDRRRGLLSRQNEDGSLDPVAIGSRALDILGLLIDRNGDVVSRNDILNTVWPGVVEGANVTVQISALRRALDDGRSAGSIIQTIPRRGYRLTAAVTRNDRLAADTAGRSVARKATAEAFAPARQPGLTEAAARASSNFERRLVTVLSCRTTGSRLDGERLDPEEALRIIGGLNKACADIVGAYGGFVANFRSGRLLAYFGYPQAHEDDAERAIRAGLTLRDAIGQLQAPDGLHAQIGIATGVVVVGDLIGEGEAQERAIVGEAPILAVRLRALAEPNTIVIADSTRAQIGALFAVEDLVPPQSDGSAAPRRAWRVIGERRGLGRFEALRSSDTPLVGREEEIALLVRRWTQAKAGDGHAVLITGEPGVGKSRLAVALETRLQAEPHLLLRYFCAPYNQDSAFYPIIAQLERTAGFEREDAPSTRLDKLESLVSTVSPSDEDMRLLADFLTLPGSERYPSIELTPQRKKQKTLDALLRQLTGLARQQPVLIVFEDLQWIDPSSCELFDLMIQRIEAWPALLIATLRPEFQPPWTGLSQVTALLLNRLGRRDAAALVQALSANEAVLPVQVVDEIVRRGDGVPLFLEELTKAVVEEAAGSSGSTVPTAPGTAPAVPTSLQASLMARFDRLGPMATLLAQVGATIGREFSYELLAETASQDDTQLRVAMTRLVEAGVVFQRGTLPEASFLFKHALVQDVAYGALLYGERRHLHGRIADTLLSTGSDRPAVAPELVAHHLQIAGRLAEAIPYWRRAGEQAARRAANREAIAHFRRALSLIEAQPEAPDRWRAELAVLVQLLPALINVHARSSPEAGEAAERAVRLGHRLESSTDLAASLTSLYNFHVGRGQLDRADEISADLFRIAGELNDPEIKLQAHHTAWTTLWKRGLLLEAAANIDAGLALYDEERHAHHRYFHHGHDPAVCALGISAVLQSPLGYPARAIRYEREAVILGRRLEHPPSLGQALGLTGGRRWHAETSPRLSPPRPSC